MVRSLCCDGLAAGHFTLLRLADGQGRTVSFSNRVAEHLLACCIVWPHNIKNPRENVMQEVRRHFRPGLLNRLDEIVVFDPLSHDELKKVARLQMKDVAIRLAERGVALGVTDDALDLVLQKGYDPVVFGLGSAAAQTSMPAMSNLTGRYSDKNHSNTSQEKNDNAKASDKMDQETKKYLRGKGVSLKNLKDKKLKGKLATKEALYKRSARSAAKVEQWLLPSEGGYLEAEGLEKTSNYKQEDIVCEVDLLSSRKAFDIKLQEFGPYIVNYTLNGRYMVMVGRKGHLSIMDWKDLRLIKELQVRETVHDVKFLHNELFFAKAQKKYTSQLCI